MKYYGLIIPPVFPTGVFIQDIKQTVKSEESGGVNTMTVTLTNQQKAYFHIKNGKQGSAAEATEQMEQHAKEYIATELTEQKTALEQAIEKANTELQQKVSKANLEVIRNIDQQFLEKISDEIPLPPPAESKAIGDAGNTDKFARADHQHPSEIEDFVFNDSFGFLKYRNGLIIQYFRIRTNSSNDIEVCFPKAFPTTVVAITSSLIIPNSLYDPHISVTSFIWDKTNVGFHFASAVCMDVFENAIWGDDLNYDIVAMGY